MPETAMMGPIDRRAFMGGAAPSDRLRAAINAGNVVLAKRNAAGSATGVPVDIARAVAVPRQASRAARRMARRS